MRFPSANVLLTAAVGACSIVLMAGAGLSHSRGTSQASSAGQPAKITIDYPLDGSIFPPEITTPTFLWRDSSDAAQRWVVQVSFADNSEPLRIAPLARNSTAFLNGTASRLRWYRRPLAGIVEFWRQRWLLPRAARDNSYQRYDASEWRRILNLSDR